MGRVARLGRVLSDSNDGPHRWQRACPSTRAGVRRQRVTTRDYKGLLALAEEVPLRRKLVVCDEKRRRLADDGVEILPVPLFLRELWEGRLLG